MAKITNFRPIYCYILEKIEDSHVVTINRSRLDCISFWCAC